MAGLWMKGPFLLGDGSDTAALSNFCLAEARDLLDKWMQRKARLWTPRRHLSLEEWDTFLWLTAPV